MIRLLTKNWPWKLLSLGAAVVVWALVSNEPEMTTILSVPIQFRNAPRDLEISSRIQGTVRLELQGLSGRLRAFSAQPSPVVLDFASVTGPGERTFNVDSGSVHLPSNVHLERAVPSQFRFDFEKTERRSVPVHVKWTGSPPDGKAIGDVSIEPENLTVVGPSSLVNRVAFVSTDPVSLATLHSGAVVVTSPFIAEEQVRFDKFVPVRVRVTFR